jgi:hypothetical protein
MVAMEPAAAKGPGHGNHRAEQQHAAQIVG